LKQIIRKSVVHFFFCIEGGSIADQTLGIKSLRREGERTKTIEPKVRITLAKITGADNVSKL
jgi:hypothetical protein